MEQIVLGAAGLSGGLIVAGGLIALLVGLGAITRFIGITHTAAHVRLYENAILLGGIFGNWMTVYHPSVSFGIPGLLLLGSFFGIFVGGWIMALAEMVNIFPIVARRAGLVKGVSMVVIAIALGKTVGSLLHFSMRW